MHLVFNLDQKAGASDQAMVGERLLRPKERCQGSWFTVQGSYPRLRATRYLHREQT